MSVFKKDFEDKVKEAIEYFKSLNPQKRAYICANLLDLDENDEEKISYLLYAISNDISNYDETTISNKLFDLGLERTYAVLLVQNMIEQAPTLQYQLKELNKFEDEVFGKKFPLIFNEMWIEKKHPKILIKDHGITAKQFKTIRDLTRVLMNNLARSKLSEKKLTKECSDVKLSKSKIQTLVNTLKINSEFWRNMVIYSNTQDSFFAMQPIMHQNELILRSLQELLNIMKKDNSDTGKIQ